VQLAKRWMHCNAILLLKILLNVVGFFFQFLVESDNNNGYLLRAPEAQFSNIYHTEKYFSKIL
jgi:hypothetical protein